MELFRSLEVGLDKRPKSLDNGGYYVVSELEVAL